MQVQVVASGEVLAALVQVQVVLVADSVQAQVVASGEVQVVVPAVASCPGELILYKLTSM